jgi:hypothetical protein
LKPPSTKYSSSSPCTPSSSRRTIATSTAAGLARHELTHRVARAAEVTEAVHRAQEGPLRASSDMAETRARKTLARIQRLHAQQRSHELPRQGIRKRLRHRAQPGGEPNAALAWARRSLSPDR